MNCPSCGNQMEDGIIESRNTLFWHPISEKYLKTTRFTTSENAVILGKCGLWPWEWAITNAYYCKHCQTVILQVPSDSFD